MGHRQRCELDGVRNDGIEDSGKRQGCRGGVFFKDSKDDHLRAGHSALDERECKWASGTRIHISIRDVAVVWVA